MCQYRRHAYQYLLVIFSALLARYRNCLPGYFWLRSRIVVISLSPPLEYGTVTVGLVAD